MRILFALPYLPSLIRVRPYNLIRELAREHEISLLATDSPRELAGAEGLRAWCRDVEVVPLRRGASLRSCIVAALRGDPLQAAVCRSDELTRRLRALLDRRAIDVVHVEHLRAAHLRAAIPDGVPTLFDAVDCISLLHARTLRSSHSLQQRLVAAVELQRTRAFEARLLGQFDQVAVTTPEDAQALARLGAPAGIGVVPNGVDLKQFAPRAVAREPATLVFSGKMSYHANVTAILHFVHRALPLIRRVRPDVRLRIVGSRPPASVQALARDPAITVTGHVPDLAAALATATVAICPVTVKVGIQNKVLEAMAMGLPVVCSRQGASGLLAEPGRDFLVAGDPAEFADRVCQLLADPARCQELGAAGRSYVEQNHTWGAAAQRLTQLYRQAIGADRAAAHPAPRGGHPAGPLSPVVGPTRP